MKWIRIQHSRIYLMRLSSASIHKASFHAPRYRIWVCMDWWSDQYTRYQVTQTTLIINTPMHTTPPDTHDSTILLHGTIHGAIGITTNVMIFANNAAASWTHIDQYYFTTMKVIIVIKNFAMLPISDPIHLIVPDSIQRFWFNSTQISWFN